MADTPLNENTLNFFKQFEDSTKKIEPVNSGLITNPDEKDFNFWEKTGRLSLSAAQGVVNAVEETGDNATMIYCLLYTSTSPRDLYTSRMPSSA